jgi:hypothetical protein
VCVANVCVRVPALCAHSRATAATCGIDRSARAVRRRPRARGCVRCHRPVLRALVAGATFTNRTSNAPWVARRWHTSVIDAAGAIYVIGGFSWGGTSGTPLHDVWVSTDGGALPGLRPGGGRGYRVGTRGGTKGGLRGY